MHPPIALLPSRPRRRPVIRGAVLLFLLPGVLAGQNIVSAGAGVERTLSFDVGFNAPVAPGCDVTDIGTTLAQASVTCTAVPGAVGVAFGSSSRDGVLKASSSLVASGLSLGAAGSTTAVLSTVGRANLHDVVSISPLTAITPTSFSLFIDLDGSYAAPASLPAGLTYYVSTFLGFSAAGFDPLQRGWSGWT